MNGEADEKAESRRIEWARMTLGATADSDRDARRSLFLRKLAENDFGPDESLEEAWRTLDREAWKIDLQGTPSFLQRDFRRWEDEIDAFQNNLFQLDGRERTTEFQRLWEGCLPHVTLRHRLIRLQPALQPSNDNLVGVDPFVTALTQELQRLFSLRPSEAAIRRRERALEMLRGPDAAKWRVAAQSIQRTQPQLAALDVSLISILTFGTPTPIGGRSPGGPGNSWRIERRYVTAGIVILLFYVAFVPLAVYLDSKRASNADKAPSLITQPVEEPSSWSQESNESDPLSDDPSRDQSARLLRDLLQNAPKESKQEEKP